MSAQLRSTVATRAQGRYLLRANPNPTIRSVQSSSSTTAQRKPATQRRKRACSSCDGSEVYEVEDVVGKRVVDGEHSYRLKWKGYTETDWIATDAINCVRLVSNFEEARVARVRAEAAAEVALAVAAADIARAEAEDARAVAAAALAAADAAHADKEVKTPEEPPKTPTPTTETGLRTSMQQPASDDIDKTHDDELRARRQLENSRAYQRKKAKLAAIGLSVRRWRNEKNAKKKQSA